MGANSSTNGDDDDTHVRTDHSTVPADGQADSTVIYPLVTSSGNQRVLTEWLANHEDYEVADDSKPLEEATFDLCIVDHEAFENHREELSAVKSAADPVLVPVLLLLPENRSEIIQADRGSIADNVFATTVDEILSLPIRQAELEWRIQALLRLRNQSLASKAQTETLRRFQKAVEASGHAIFITDSEGTIEYVNSAFEEITGYSRTDAVGETPEILDSGEMSSAFFDELWETILAGETWESELINRRKDGETYAAYQTIAPITEGGEIDAFVAVQTDVSERNELQTRLKRHRDIVQRLDDPIMLQDTDGSFRLVNEAVAEFAGVDKEALLSDDESLFMDDETAATIEQQKTEVVETETPSSYSVSPTFERSGKEATFSTRRYPYYDDDGDLVGTIAICRDVTDLERRTSQLRVIDTILRHNLRNTLTVIRNEAEQIHDDISEDLSDRVETILDQIDRLETTGEKSRAITKVLSEEPTTKHVGLAHSVRSVVEQVNEEHPHAEIEVTAPDSVVISATFNVDEAIEELVRNAIVHHDGEDPWVKLAVTEQADTVEVSVLDDGPGMTGMDRTVLETGDATEDLYHGSGLGLWLVYWIVNRSDGSVEVSERAPRGTRVTLSFSKP